VEKNQTPHTSATYDGLSTPALNIRLINQYNLFTTLHDQNKNGFFEGLVFFPANWLFKNFTDCSDWLDKNSRFCFDHVNKL